MNKIIALVILIISNVTFAQQEVKLRELMFSVPTEFIYFTQVTPCIKIASFS